MAAAATDTTQAWKAAIEKAEGDLFNLHEQSTKRGTRHIKEVVNEVVDEIQLAYNNKGHIAGGVQLGFTDLDRVIMGLKTGLFVIAARPSRGKTVLACQIALNVGTGRGHYHEFKQAPIPVLFFSLETTDRALTRRMLLNEWTVPISKARDGLMSRAEQDKLGAAVAELRRSHIWLHESFGMTIQELRATARMQISRLPERTDGLPKCVVLLDYLQLISSSSRRAQQSRQIEIAEISMGLKHLAHEFDIPVITLAQLNRDGDKARPGMADLRESGQIEQDADYIGMICDAPEELTQGEDGLPSEQEYMGFDLAKNKDGPTTTDGAPLVFPFDKSIFRLRSWSDSLLSNNARDYQAGYKKPAKASKKEPGKNWRDKSAPAGASLADFED
jgi:replicative DNA helicase